MVIILSVNAGSSSLKVSVFEQANLTTPKDTLSIEGIDISQYQEAIQRVTTWLTDELSIQPQDIEAIGHRVVHGGEQYSNAARVTPDLLAYLGSITPLAPNHMPATLASLQAFLEAYPTASHVACFDTSFFHDLPEVARTLPLPLTLQKEHSIRRYGFHGLSYQSLLASFAKHEGPEAAHGRVIMAHLGSGASIAACKDGKPVDVSMGFTPVSGIMMSTRTGDIEPGVLVYLQKKLGLGADELLDFVTHKSGLLGVSESTADMYTLLQNQQNDPKSALAVELFCYKAKKTMGGYIAALGGVDSIMFSGGIGERSAEIRRRILDGLAFAGVELDEARNEQNERLISATSSRVGVHVIPAQEDFSIVTQTIEVINKER